MAKEIRLPQLGESMEEGIIVKQLVEIGKKVEKGDSVFEIETNKATFELESPVCGFVKKILVEEGQTVSVNTAIAVLGDEGEEISPSYIDTLNAEVVPITSSRANSKLSTNVKKSSGRPINKKLDTVSFGDKIVLSRKQIAARNKMLQSKLEIPCFYLNTRADITELLELGEGLNNSGNPKVKVEDFIIRAAGLGLQEFPVMRGQLCQDSILIAGQINISVAVSGAEGPVRVVIKDVESKGLAEVAACREKLIARAMKGNLSEKDQEGGSLTISNLGEFGINMFIPIVVPGQCSILGVGRIADVYIPAGGDDIEARKLINLTIAVDHKVANGAEAAQFLDFVKKMLENAKNLI
jgi:pyruvate dehydrogenase E2 component (dihydrolipoamide acetyltransferase)